ncbi:MAG: NfeD family protein [Planctomycetota bacterium]
MMFTLAQQTVNTTDPDGAFLVFGGLLMAAAILLLFVELIIPSGGLIGVLSGVAAITGIVCFFRYSNTAGIVALSTTLVLGPVIVFVMFKIWINSPMGKAIVLGGETRGSNEETFVASELARSVRIGELRELIGVHGTTVTALRPVGTVKIAGKRIDALAETGIIEAGVEVEVTDAYDNQLKVRPAAAATDP